MAIGHFFYLRPAVKLFNKARWNALVGDNASKYLKYALGEIVLVVIGILIAIQINDWNDNRKEEKLKLKYFDRIQQELDDLEKQVMLNSLYVNDSMVPVLRNTISSIDNRNPLTAAEFESSLNVLTENEALGLQLPIIREFLNQGSLSSVKSASVSQAFQHLEYCVHQRELIDDNVRQEHLQLIKPYLNKLIPYEVASSHISLTKTDTTYLEEIYDDFYLRNLFANRMENLILGSWRNAQLIAAAKKLSEEMKNYGQRYRD
jgi:hypothetical protein